MAGQQYKVSIIGSGNWYEIFFSQDQHAITHMDIPFFVSLFLKKKIIIYIYIKYTIGVQLLLDSLDKMLKKTLIYLIKL